MSYQPFPQSFPDQYAGQPPAPQPVPQLGVGYIEELAVPYDPSELLAKLRKRRGAVRGRIIGLVITVLVLGAIYLWQRASFPQGAFVIYGILLGVNLIWLGIVIALWAQTKRELGEVGQGIALRIGRAGVQIRDQYAPWAAIGALRVKNGKLGRAPRFSMEHQQGSADIAMDQIPVLPATLDTTARAYSAGKRGVDLSALDA